MLLNNIEIEVLEEIEFKPENIGSNTKKYFKGCCIYCIQNIINKKFYIGSTLGFNKRIGNHRKDLKHGKHHSQHFQRAFNKTNIENFKVFILEKTTKENKIEREQYYLDLLTPYKENIGYNISNSSYSAQLGKSVTREVKDKIALKNGRGVFQIDSEGNIIKEFPSGCEAARINKIHQSAISQCIVNKVHKAGGFIWMINTSSKEDILNKVKYINNKIEKFKIERIENLSKSYLDKKGVNCKSIKLVQIDKLSNKVINTFDCLSHAEKHTGINHTCIGECLKNKRISAGGYFWKSLNKLEYVS